MIMDDIERRQRVGRELRKAGYTFKKVQELYGLNPQELTYHLERPFVRARVVNAVNKALNRRFLDERGQIIQ